MKVTPEGLRMSETVDEALFFLEALSTKQTMPDFVPDNASMAAAFKVLSGADDIKEFVLLAQADPAILVSRLSQHRAGMRPGKSAGKLN